MSGWIGWVTSKDPVKCTPATACKCLWLEVKSQILASVFFFSSSLCIPESPRLVFLFQTKDNMLIRCTIWTSLLRWWADAFLSFPYVYNYKDMYIKLQQRLNESPKVTLKSDWYIIALISFHTHLNFKLLVCYNSNKPLKKSALQSDILPTNAS